MAENKTISKHLLNKPNVQPYLIKDDGHFPNNSSLPLLVYSDAVKIGNDDSLGEIEQLINSNGWSGAWLNGVFPYHHYHSTAHESLIVCKGEARIQFGGDQGMTLHLKIGDAVVLPAGMAHKKLDQSPDFQVMGAYPDGQNYDMNYGTDSERRFADQNIAKVPLPQADPLYGKKGPLMSQWSK
jgi:uncharacterized protein YjlB